MGKSNTTVSITDVSPEIFRHLLYYVYGGKVSEEDLKSNTREIIDAADKYGIVNLKLEAEALLVTSTTITIENMLDLLLYSSSKNCALLQEAVLDFALENSDEVSEKVLFDDVPGTIVADLLAATSRKYKGGKEGGEDLNTMRVSELRKKLHEEGLDIDGSRKAMIATLKKHLVKMNQIVKLKRERASRLRRNIETLKKEREELMEILSLEEGDW